jgi:hypothetical protein
MVISFPGTAGQAGNSGAAGQGGTGGSGAESGALCNLTNGTVIFDYSGFL